MSIIAKSIEKYNYWIDCAPYCEGKSLRFCNSYKYDPMTKKYDQRAYVVEKEEFLKTIVTNTNDCIQIPHSISLTKDGFYDVETNCSETLELIKAVLEPKFDGITFE